MKKFSLLIIVIISTFSQAQNHKNMLSVNMNVNTFYKRNYLLQLFEEKYGRQYTYDFTLSYSAKIFEKNKSTFRFGVNFDADIFRYHYSENNLSNSEFVGRFNDLSLGFNVAHSYELISIKDHPLFLLTQVNQYFNFGKNVEQSSILQFKKIQTIISLNYQLTKNTEKSSSIHLGFGTTPYDLMHFYRYRFYTTIGLSMNW